MRGRRGLPILALPAVAQGTEEEEVTLMKSWWLWQVAEKRGWCGSGEGGILR